MVGKPAAALLHGISHVPAPTSMAATICACWTLGITGTRTVEQAELRVALDEMRVGGGFERSVGVGLAGGVGEGLPLSPRAAVLAVLADLEIAEEGDLPVEVFLAVPGLVLLPC